VRKIKAPFYTEKLPKTVSGWLVVRLCLIALSLGPFVYEGSLVIYGRWMRVLGYHASIRTPVLDSVYMLAHSARVSLMTQFRRVPWNPQAVLVVGVLSCLACMFLLKGRGSRVE
jgi:hypothetical protein